jgi:hypothetical protein
MSDKPKSKKTEQWFPSSEQLAEATKTGALFTYTPDPAEHLMDANQGKVTSFATPSPPNK